MRTADKTTVSWWETFGFYDASDPGVIGVRRRAKVAAGVCVALVFALMCVNIAAFAMSSQAAALDMVLKRLEREQMELKKTADQNTARHWIKARAAALGMTPYDNQQRVSVDHEAP